MFARVAEHLPGRASRSLESHGSNWSVWDALFKSVLVARNEQILDRLEHRQCFPVHRKAPSSQPFAVEAMSSAAWGEAGGGSPMVGNRMPLNSSMTGRAATRGR